MPAIITDDFRRNQARLLVNDIKASADSNFDSSSENPAGELGWPYRGNNRYSIGLGKADPWVNDSNGNSESTTGFSPPTPEGTIQEDHDVISNLSVLKDVAGTGVKQLIAKNPWTPGRKYKVYDEADDDMFYTSGDMYPCVVTDNNKVYLCLSNTATTSNFTAVLASNTQPQANSLYGVTVKGDAQGYVWAHVANIAPADPLLTNQFVPINSSPSITPAQKQLTGGLISHIGITNGGTGYTNPPSVLITAVDYNGNVVNTGISARSVIDGGVVTRIDLVDANQSPLTDGSESYWDHIDGNHLNATSSNRVKYVTVAIAASSGTNATAYATVAPANGYAINAIDILPTWFVGLTAEFVNTETDNDAAIIDFRQVSLLKNFTRNPNHGEGSDAAGAITLDALKYVKLAGTPDTQIINSLSQGDVLTCGTSPGAKFYFDYYDSATKNLYYHQNSNPEVNFIDPPASTAVKSGTSTIANTDGNGTYRPEYNAYDSPPDAYDSPPNGTTNGEVIFHENRAPFQRGSSQTEEVKLIIQL